MSEQRVTGTIAKNEEKGNGMNNNLASQDNGQFYRNENIRPSIDYPTYQGMPPYLYGVMNGIATNQQNLVLNMQQLNSSFMEIKKERGRNHRSILEQQIALTSDGRVNLVKSYSDGTDESVLLILNMRGPFEILGLSFMKDKYRLFLIMAEEQVWMVGEMNRITQQKLYDMFLRAGIKFNPKLRKSVIMKALYEEFAPRIDRCDKKIEISGLPGMENGRFYCASDFSYLATFGLEPDLPVLKKKFNKKNLYDSEIEVYRRFMGKISSLELRVMLLLFPLAAIMNSTLEGYGLVVPFVPNFILMTEKITPKTIAQYIQVYNRHRTEIYNVNDSNKNLEEIMRVSKDEILIFVGLQNPTINKYMNDKIIRNLQMVAEAGSKQGFSNMETQALIALVSNQIVMSRRVRNIFVDDDGMCSLAGPNQMNNKYSYSVDAVLALFVQYFEQNFEIVERSVKNDYKETINGEHYWNAVITIVDDFWHRKGTSMHKILDLEDGFCFDFLWKDDEADIEKGTDLMVSSLRHMMPQLKVANKNDEKADGSCVIYDDENIWISPELLNRVFEASGINSYKNLILLDCREKEMLIADRRGGFLTRLQIKNSREEYYRFHRDSFNKLGKAEIIDLGRR